MNTTKENTLVENYFGSMKSWDDATKKQLIAKLEHSIQSTEERQSDFSVCFGTWEDAKTANEIANDLRKDGTNNLKIEDF